MCSCLCSDFVQRESSAAWETQAEPLDKPRPLPCPEKTPMSFLRPLFPRLRSSSPPSGPRPAAAMPTGSTAAATSRRDPAWRFGTLPNGLRYAVRRNALPAGQVSIRIRIDAGSLHEQDQERGWAHFVEHMLFRGTKSYPDRRGARDLAASWARASAATPTPTPAPTRPSTSSTCPTPTAASLDTSLAVLAEMMWQRPLRARGGRRRSGRSCWPKRTGGPRSPSASSTSRAALLSPASSYGERDTIGTEATLNAATAEGLRAFYRRWYRPDRATIVMVGDADPAMMEQLIRTHFGGWPAAGPAPAEPDYGRDRRSARSRSPTSLIRARRMPRP